MPDQPPSRRSPEVVTPTSVTNGHYAELHCRTNYSFLEGASHPDELVNRAAELGLKALAVTDRNSLAGVVRAHVAAKEANLKLLVGAEITPVDSLPVVLLATDRAAYANLSQLITHGRRRSPKGECHLTFDDITHHAQGLLACVPLPVDSDPVVTRQLLNYRTCFPEHCYGLVALHRGPNDGLTLNRLKQLAKDVNLPLAASNNVHYHIPDRQPLQDVLTAIRHGCTVAELGHRRFSNAERHLKSAMEMQCLFAEAPEAVAHTLDVAERCTFSLDELRYEYPEELCPNGTTPAEHLTHLTWHGASRRYPTGLSCKVRELIQHELALITELKYEAYFLTVYDLVRFARERGILCQGRGSAANSAVCFCLGITEVDPNRIEVLFERFMSKERDEPPDIDVDFEHERREEVIQYIYERYGRERAGMTGVVITYRVRSAVRDVGKALGYSMDYVNRLANSVDHLVSEQSLAEQFHTAGSADDTQLFQSLVSELLHFPRHLSQHPGGMVMTRGMLSDFVPIENTAMPDRTVIQWDKNDLDALGLLKVDILALGMLTAIRRCFSLIQQHYGKQFTLANVPAEDHAVYEMVCQADTIGVFQIESRAQMSMLPRLQPRCFYDLVIEVAIVRPGPIQGDMVHPYLRRRCGEEPVEYADDRIRSVLYRTLGVPIFQEQAMKLAVVAAGFTPGEADQLRKAMGAWRRQGVIEQFQQKLVSGMADNGYDNDFAERVFRQIQGFGEYGFPESHAASFALLVYVSAWLKHHYPAAFTAALLNSQPMGFYGPSQLVSDARKHGVTIRPVDVCASDWDCNLEATQTGEYALRLGFRMLKGMSGDVVKTICAARLAKMFFSFEDFRHRTRLSSGMLSKLSEADAFQSLKMNRRQALWHSLPDQSEQPLFDGQLDNNTDKAVCLPSMPRHEQVLADYKTAGLSLKGHPLKTYRTTLQQQGVKTADQLLPTSHGLRVRVAGLVLVRQHPGSANGVTFVTLEDETGTINLIIRPDVWHRFRTIAGTAAVLIARGQLQHQHNVIHVLVDQLKELTTTTHNIHIKPRNFR